MRIFENIRFALRMARRSPSVAVSAILAAGLGIGASSAIFSVIDGVLLRPLPFDKPEQLVNIWESFAARHLFKIIVAPANFYDFRAQNHVFSSIGAYQSAAFGIAVNGGEPVRYQGAACDPGFFSVLGVSPILGRSFTSEETQPGHDAVILLSYGLWQERFGGDPGVLGRTLEINGRQRTVIGVMPRGFDYPSPAVIWGPLPLDPPSGARRDLHSLRVIARLKDGVTLGQARAELQTISARLAAQYADLNKGDLAIVNPVLDDLVGDVRPALLVLVAAVAFVLLIACANVANLLLAQASARQREMAIRASLGAGRRAILAQMLTESVVLSLLGGALGLAITAIGFRALLHLAPASLPRLENVTLNWRVIDVSLILSVLTGVLFGFAPAWYAARIDVNSMLKEGSRGSGSRNRLRAALMAGQVAVAVILLTGAGLLLRSFYEIIGVDAGFDPEHVITMQLQPAAVKYAGHRDLQIQLARQITDRISQLPGVRAAGITTALPLLGNPAYIMRIEGRPPVPVSQAPVVAYFAVTPGFFDAMGMRIIKGRALSPTDDVHAPQVVVINQSFADRYYPGEDPIGKRMEIGFATPPNWRQIVGVVADAKTEGLDHDTPVQAYTAFFQIPWLIPSQAPPMAVLARTSGDPSSLAGAVKSTILSVDSSQPVFAVQPLTEIVAQSIAQRRVALVLLAFFAASALLLASIGVYGIVSYAVTQRTAEIGIRMALGAQSSQVAILIGREGMTLVLAGLAAGIAGLLVVNRWIAPLLFHVSPRDPAIIALASASLLLVSIAACFLPARRASRLDPLIALRAE